MKIKGILKWFVVWDKHIRFYAVKKGGFTDSTHQHKIDALKRAIELEKTDIP